MPLIRLMFHLLLALMIGFIVTILLIGGLAMVAILRALCSPTFWICAFTILLLYLLLKN